MKREKWGSGGMTFPDNERIKSDLAAYEAFLAIAARGSITKAAEQLGRSVQAVSRDLAKLEQDLGVLLAARTTRTLRLTDAGHLLADRTAPLLLELEAVREEVRSQADVIAGTLRVAASSYFGPQILTPIIAEFMARHPRLSVVLEVADSIIDPAISGADVTVRIGRSPDTSAIARRIGEARQVLVASPAYLARHGTPVRLADLEHHHCVIRTSEDNARRWLLRVNGRSTPIAVSGIFETDSLTASIRAMEAGLGIGRAALWQVRDALDQERLHLVLTDFEPAPHPIRALRPPARIVPARTRLFIDHLARRLALEGF